MTESAITESGLLNFVLDSALFLRSPPRDSNQHPRPDYWAAVKELNLSCHNPETILFPIYPYYGNLN